MPVQEDLEHLSLLRDAVLYCAADLIARQGWSRRGSRPQLCITQALADVTGFRDDTEMGSVPDRVSTAAILAVLDRIGGEYIADVFEWESEAGRTQDDVLSLLRAAASGTS